MTYFSSEYECKLDAKGRMVLPARFKSSLPEASESRIVLTRGFEPCITIYPLQEWQKIFERVASLDEFNPQYRRFQRNFLRGNTEVELDKSGRFLIPRTMARYAQLDREAILIGMGNRIEVWNPDMYEEFLINDQEEFSFLAQRFLSKDPASSPAMAPATQPPSSKEAEKEAAVAEEPQGHAVDSLKKVQSPAGEEEAGAEVSETQRKRAEEERQEEKKERPEESAEESEGHGPANEGEGNEGKEETKE